MNFDHPATGTTALLERLDPFIPDDFINEYRPHGHTGGRQREHSAANSFGLLRQWPGGCIWRRVGPASLATLPEMDDRPLPVRLRDGIARWLTPNL